mmetsp:Transcript_9017/g.16367  ORF Transcript_9017/g.16367 Transcript_9017/m.16367 type:complete len:112 (-) Transcript_9017:814-1149(-)
MQLYHDGNKLCCFATNGVIDLQPTTTAFFCDMATLTREPSITRYTPHKTLAALDYVYVVACLNLTKRPRNPRSPRIDCSTAELWLSSNLRQSQSNDDNDSAHLSTRVIFVK